MHCWKKNFIFFFYLYLNPIVYTFILTISGKFFLVHKYALLILMAKSILGPQWITALNICLVTLSAFLIWKLHLCHFWNFCAFCINHFLFNPSEHSYIHPHTLFALFSFLSSVYLTMLSTEFLFLECLPIPFLCGSFFHQFFSKFS